MKTEQAKALFFAQYLGQKVYRRNGVDYDVEGYVTTEKLHGDIFATDGTFFIDNAHLLIKLVSQLTDEEKVIIAGRMQIYPEDLIDWINGDCGHSDYENLHTWLPCYDLLKAFGILLPFTYLDENNKPVTLQPNDIIALGWAKHQS